MKMDPTIRKLPKSVQSLICASNQINSYTKAVQELVFNALDADATSVAVRTNISEGSIQVVDNGSGITQADFKNIGQNYMTSKLVDISSLKSAPNKYGFQGQSLANLAQICMSLKLTSRFYKCETTCVKTFENGKAKSTAKCNSRPSKGTTIEIKGFLYNLSIQKKTVDSISELQGIKTFLEHISIVHTSISLSLRDDSENEILYKIYKNRDIYQTLSTLYEIEKSNVQELQVEKNQYKVKAYVGKHDVETNGHLIFLNGKFISDTSFLHKKVNENLKKHLKLSKNIIKKNKNNANEHLKFRNKIPFYCIFITCPYMDYELTNTILEFKDWEQMNVILDKLIKFYIGDIQLQVVPKNQITKFISKPETESNKNQIEKIMQKILGSHSKKPIISQMQRGVKGKLIKRKPKSKKKLSKLMSKKNSKEQKRQGLRETLMNEQNSNTKESISKIRSKQKNYKSRKEHTLLAGLTKTSVEKHTKPKLSKQLKSKNKLTLHRNNVATKQKDEQCLKKLTLNSKFAKKTESVKRRVELLDQKTKKCIENHKINTERFIKKNVQVTRSNFISNNKNIAIHKRVKETIIHKYIPKSKFNFDIMNGNIKKNKLFKTNYDLLQTIISSQIINKESRALNAQSCSVQDISTESGLVIIPDIKKTDGQPLVETILPANNYCLPSVRESNNPTPLQSKTPDHNVIRESDKMSSFKRITPNSSRSFVRELESTSPFQLEKPINWMQCKDKDNKNIPFQGDTLEHSSRHFDKKSGDISSSRPATFNSNVEPYSIRASDDASPFQIQATLQSHNYVEQDFQTDANVELQNFCKKPSFITTRSRDFFTENNRIKQNKTNIYSKAIKSNNHKRTHKKSMKIFDITDKDIRESYTIEFTESKEYNSPKNQPKNGSIKQNIGSIKALASSMQASNIFDDVHYQCMSTTDPKTWLIFNYNSRLRELDYEPTNENTFAITNSYLSDNTFENINGRYTIDSKNKSCNTIKKSEMTKYSTSDTSNNGTSFVFVSQENDDKIRITNPIDVCETVLENPEISINRPEEVLCFDINQDISNNLSVKSNNADKMGDTLYEFNFDKYIEMTSNGKNEPNDLIKSQSPEEFKETSHHFSTNNRINSTKQTPTLIKKHDSNLKARNNAKNINKQDPNKQNKNATVTDTQVVNNTGAFNIKNRMFFVPKGMSPIFEECQINIACKCDSREEYYADKIYNDFVDKVQNDTIIFKPNIQDTSDLTTKDVSKGNNKLNKNNASLKFDGLCIKNANVSKKVLGQVDSKFIAATIKSKSRKPDDLEEFLVLFDQHAVHERIRLEKNLADYLTGSQWKSVAIDEVTLKMSRDDILYLHNYRYKFTQFGLQWDILNYNEISLSAIPEGILGKNPRQVDKIIIAVKNLITEEINIMQTQRGCVSLYPKSIMDLVFSEACRYAIKFGDHLSKSKCTKLLDELSDCKTPFQCAHGRPAMAVIMNIESNQANYKINFKKLKLQENLIK